MQKVVRLFIALSLLWIVAVVVIPAINKLPYLIEVQKLVRKWDINTSAFFYTDHISSNEEIKKYTDK